MEAKARGARLIHVDPRFTRTSAMAIALYFFTGGLAGASSTLALGGRLAGARRRRSVAVTAGTLLTGGSLLPAVGATAAPASSRLRTRRPPSALSADGSTTPPPRRPDRLSYAVSQTSDPVPVWVIVPSHPVETAVTVMVYGPGAA